MSSIICYTHLDLWWYMYSVYQMIYSNVLVCFGFCLIFFFLIFFSFSVLIITPGPRPNKCKTLYLPISSGRVPNHWRYPGNKPAVVCCARFWDLCCIMVGIWHRGHPGCHYQPPQQNELAWHSRLKNDSSALTRSLCTRGWTPDNAATLSLAGVADAGLYKERGPLRLTPSRWIIWRAQSVVRKMQRSRPVLDYSPQTNRTLK